MKTKLLLIVIVALVGSTICSRGAVAGTLQLIRSIDFPYPHAADASSLAWDGEYLWSSRMSGGDPATTFVMDPSDGSVVSSFQPPGFVMGITWDGAHLWVATTQVPLVDDDARDYLKKLSTDGSVITSLLLEDSPAAKHGGAAWDGTFVWLSDYENGRINQVDPTDGSIVNWFSSPGADPLGLEWVDDSLWNMDRDGTIYQLDTFGNILETWSAPVRNAGGIAYDGEYFWVIDKNYLFEDIKLLQLAVPEPSTLALMSAGIISVLVVLMGYRGTRSRRLSSADRRRDRRTPHGFEEHAFLDHPCDVGMQ